MTSNYKKVKKKERTVEEEETLNELADIFVEAILYELKTEHGLKDTDSLTIQVIE